jgi:hypothetical protein
MKTVVQQEICSPNSTLPKKKKNSGCWVLNFGIWFRCVRSLLQLQLDFKQIVLKSARVRISRHNKFWNKIGTDDQVRSTPSHYLKCDHTHTSILSRSRLQESESHVRSFPCAADGHQQWHERFRIPKCHDRMQELHHHLHPGRVGVSEWDVRKCKYKPLAPSRSPIQLEQLGYCLWK